MNGEKTALENSANPPLVAFENSRSESPTGSYFFPLPVVEAVTGKVEKNRKKSLNILLSHSPHPFPPPGTGR